MPVRLFEYSYAPNFEGHLEELAAMAEVEHWGYGSTTNGSSLSSLFSYIDHTFRRLEEESKVAATEDASAFNTGLVTPNQEEIFGYFEKNTGYDPAAGRPQKWYFVAFIRESDRAMSQFSKLPEMAHYFENPADLLYDARLDLRKNVDHILDDNADRFPIWFRGTLTRHQQIIILEGAIDHAIQRVRRNYKTAVPQFYRPKGVHQGRLQLLLPISLKEPTTPDLALAVERRGDVYVASTCLTLDMAYKNARLIARPDSDWLKPTDTGDEKADGTSIEIQSPPAEESPPST